MRRRRLENNDGRILHKAMPRCKREQTQMTITIDRTHFTPLASLAGGLYLLGAGRIAGIAGIVGTALQSLRTRPSNAAPAWWFIAGFCPGPAGLFVVAMLAGMLLHDNARVRRRRKVAPA